jgi:LmbE family N-acetylglucosaminyl deacetylase
MSPDVRSLGTILGVWAHPDDEAFLSAGVMAAARTFGQRVVVTTATRGEKGTPDADIWPPDRLAVQRELELSRSLDTLGVTEHSVLGFGDGGCAEVPRGEGVARVAELIEQVEPDTILTFGPDGYTGHGDHRAVSDWVDGAVTATRSPTRVLHATASPEFLINFDDVHREFNVFFGGQPSVTASQDMALNLELSGWLLGRKVAALKAQETQTGGLIARMGERRFTEWIATESFAG